MPVPDTLKINEIFASFQGEGCRFGCPSIFVRLSGCSLRCDFCDTPESWRDEGQELTTAEVMRRVLSLRPAHPDAQLVITGGEPLEQAIAPLVAKAKGLGFYVAIETSGAFSADFQADWWAVAPKGRAGYRIDPSLRDRVDEIKLVVDDALNTEVVRSLRSAFPDRPIFLQPDLHNQGASAYRRVVALYEKVAESGVWGVRVGMQLHQVYGMP